MGLRSACPIGLLALLGVLSACTEQHGVELVAPTTEEAELVGPLTTPISDADLAAHERLARGIARALQRPALRNRMKVALRHSPYSEHKLDAVSFLTESASGRAILEAASVAEGLSVEETEAALERFAGFDLYVPAREDRLNWRGNTPLTVGLLSHEQPVLLIIEPDGGMSRSAPGYRPSGPFVALAPAEPKFVRVGYSAEAIRGDDGPIQEAGESDMGFQFEWTSTEGDGGTLVSGGPANADCLEACNEGGGGGGGGGGYPPPGYYADPEDNTMLLDFRAVNFGDPDGIGGCSELRFKFKFWKWTRIENGYSVHATGVYTLSGVCPDVIDRSVFRTVLNVRIPHYSNQYITTQYYEVDDNSFWNNDDYWGADPVYYNYLNNGRPHEIVCGFGCDPIVTSRCESTGSYPLDYPWDMVCQPTSGEPNPVTAIVRLEWEPIYTGYVGDEGGPGGPGGPGGGECPSRSPLMRDPGPIYMDDDLPCT